MPAADTDTESETSREDVAVTSFDTVVVTVLETEHDCDTVGDNCAVALPVGVAVTDGTEAEDVTTSETVADNEGDGKVPVAVMDSDPTVLLSDAVAVGVGTLSDSEFCEETVLEMLTEALFDVESVRDTLAVGTSGDCVWVTVSDVVWERWRLNVGPVGEVDSLMVADKVGERLGDIVNSSESDVVNEPEMSEDGDVVPDIEAVSERDAVNVAERSSVSDVVGVSEHEVLADTDVGKDVL